MHSRRRMALVPLGVLYAYRVWALLAVVGNDPCQPAFSNAVREMASLSGTDPSPCVLLLVAPSGLWMASYAAAGPIAAAGLAVLAVATGMCFALGWRLAVKRRFPAHRRWMLRGFLFVCSAVVLRLSGGLATVTGVTATWVDPLATWMSWLIPLTAFELSELGNR